MEPNLTLISKGLSPLLAPVSRQIGKHLIGEEILERRKLNETALQPVLQKAAETVSERIQCYEPAEIDQICLFLESPPAETIVRQIYAAQLSDHPQNNFELIRQEWLAAFSDYTNIPESELQDAANLILDDLIEGCEEALQIAIDRGRLSAHDAKSAFRHQIVRDEIATIQKTLNLLTAPRKPDIKAILTFEENYRQQVGERHKYIIPPDFDKAQKLPINRLYVCPNFIPTPTKQTNQPESLKIKTFLASIYRVVLLGNPGGGKSTFTQKFAHVLATCYSERPFAGRQVTPILVILRDYGAKKKQINCSIVQYIETKANSDYQTPPPPRAFEYLLLTGRVVVIFDGLDELLDTSYRREISSDIELFCNLYPSVPVLVTSREVGYDQAPLDPEKFEVFRLAPFDENQVKEYVTTWFKVNEEPEEKGEAFLNESQFVSDLRSNPLMLALMCNLYRREGYIPRNRPEVYKECAEMLFETWDKNRDIPVEFRFEDNIRPAVAHLAYWIYTDEDLQGGVTERQLIVKLSQYWLENYFDDRDKAERAAREFIKLCRGRVWVFTGIGTTADGEELYQFTYRTFLEYFTALYLFRTQETAKELAEFLLPKIAQKEWDVVAQLAFQIKSKNPEGAGDKLLTTVLYAVREAEAEEAENLLSFAARCLEFMVPSAKVTRKITKACIEYLLESGIKLINLDEYSQGSSINFIRSGKTLLLLNAATENQGTIAESLEKLLIERFKKNSDEREALVLFEISSHLWQGVSQKIFDACYDCMEQLYPKYFLPCHIAWQDGRISVGNLINWHGTDSLFCDAIFSIFSDGWGSVAECLMQFMNKYRDLYNEMTDVESQLNDLREIGKILLYSSQPWINGERYDTEILSRFRCFYGDNLQKSLEQGSDVIFGVFAVLSTALELEQISYPDDAPFLVDELLEDDWYCFGGIRWILIARFQPVPDDKVQAEMDRCGFSLEQQDFIWRWIRREINLVADTEEEEEIF
ncbi:NACHT domain family [Coleofasciculus chthonoplastes PCC 7420]|uniref:NACHT domain family n=1 Tax=Coleofasciculus chthonoplastes PCC 7420 TaxID=118168 RepID=B4W1B6_9CYAN|nr:NACHT domain-containing protein [Coleofasciculus chthonoplastes]EDX72139.1 NACHT domain family [Coleofasciculus chthonoplastes PCC 7420]